MKIAGPAIWMAAPEPSSRPVPIADPTAAMAICPEFNSWRRPGSAFFWDADFTAAQLNTVATSRQTENAPITAPVVTLALQLPRSVTVNLTFVGGRWIA